jgi:hypothetical protein
MADAENFDSVFEGLEIKDEMKTELTGRLTKFKTDLENPYLEKMTEAESKLKEAIETRQRAKDKAKELEDKLAKGEFEGKKEMSDLLEKYRTDIDSMTNEHTSVKEQLESKSKEFDKFIKIQKDKILKEIPQNLKPAAEKMGLEDLGNFYEGLVKEKIIVDKSVTTTTNTNHKKPKTLVEWQQTYTGA